MVMTTEKLKAAVPIRYKPYAPENLFLKKEEVLRRKRIEAEKAAEMKAAEAEIDAKLADKYKNEESMPDNINEDKGNTVIPGNPAAPVVEKKKAGRPKKIE